MSLQSIAKKTLEKFSVLVVYWYIPVTVLLFCFWCLPLMFTYGCWVPLAYYVWYMHDTKTPYKAHDRATSKMRTYVIWKLFASYFPVKLHCPNQEVQPLDPEKNYLFVNHTYGTHNIGIKLAMGTEALRWSRRFPNLTPYVATTTKFFHIPLIRDICLGLGFINNCNETLDAVFNGTSGKVVAMTIAGRDKRNVYSLRLKRRKDFIEIALRNGVSIIPVLSFGENKMFKTLEFDSGNLVTQIINFITVPLLRTRFRSAIHYGCGWILPVGIFPFRTPIHIVVGNPIDIPRIENANEDDINKYHGQYLAEMGELFKAEVEKYVKNSEKIQLKLV